MFYLSIFFRNSFSIFFYVQMEEHIVSNTLDMYAIQLLENSKDLIKIINEKINLAMRLNIESMIILDIHGKCNQKNFILGYYEII